MVSGGRGEGAGGQRRASRWAWLGEGVAAAPQLPPPGNTRSGTKRSVAMGGSRAPPERLGGRR